MCRAMSPCSCSTTLEYFLPNTTVSTRTQFGYVDPEKELSLLNWTPQSVLLSILDFNGGLVVAVSNKFLEQ